MSILDPRTLALLRTFEQVNPDRSGFLRPQSWLLPPQPLTQPGSVDRSDVAMPNTFEPASFDGVNIAMQPVPDRAPPVDAMEPQPNEPRRFPQAPTRLAPLPVAEVAPPPGMDPPAAVAPPQPMAPTRLVAPLNMAGVGYDPATGRKGPGASLNAGATMLERAGIAPSAPSGIAAAAPGVLSGLRDSGVLGDMLMGWASGGTWQDSLARGGQAVAAGRQSRREQQQQAAAVNQTAQAALQLGVDPMIVDSYVAMGDGKGLLGLVVEAQKQRMAPPDYEIRDVWLDGKKYTARVNPVTGEAMPIGDAAPEEGVAPTQIARLIEERNALPEGDPMRGVYDAALAKETQGSGFMLETAPDGSVRVAQGAAAGGKPFTEAQSKDNVFATRAEGALGVLDQYAPSLANLGDRVLDVDPTGLVRGRLQSTEYQLGRQAGDEFLQAILRKDTGAAITEQEQELYGKTYLPQPGDGPEVLAQKQAARRRAVDAINAGMSPAQMIVVEKALAAGQQPNAPPAANADGWTELPNGIRIREKGAN